MKIRNWKCKLFGCDLEIDTKERTGTCKRCEKTYRLSYDMTYGETIIENEIKTSRENEKE